MIARTAGKPLEPIEPTAWHVCVLGHSQGIELPTGVDQVWLQLGRLRSPRTCVCLLPWNTRWADFADLVHRVSRQDAIIRVYAYSLGAGWGFIRLAEELGARGFKIRSAVLADPVFRSPWLSLFWKTFLRSSVIRIPDSVEGDVWWTRQTRSWPRAHNLLAADPRKTKIHPPVERILRHRFMDEDRAFQDRCLWVAGLLDEEPNPHGLRVIS